MISVHGADSHHLAVPELDLDVTARGGHLAPVVFHLPGRDVSPYSLAPWQPHEFPDIPPVLAVLRGDFFCLPFGEDPRCGIHGAPANDTWALAARDDRSLTLALEAADTGAQITKILSTRPGHHAVYAEHRVRGLDGDFNYGNHPVLDFSQLADGAGRVSVSPFHWASVFPGVFSNPANGEAQALEPSAGFTDLSAVPLAAGGTADLTRYPARHGFEDLVMMANQPATVARPFAWSAAVFDGWLWFAVKNPADFPVTLFWISNAGRSAAPWNSRHSGRLGIEEVCSYFSLEDSRRRPLDHLGIPTVRRFFPEETVSLRVIQGVAPVPAGFGLVTEITPDGEHSVTIRDEHGTTVHTPLDWTFAI